MSSTAARTAPLRTRSTASSISGGGGRARGPGRSAGAARVRRRGRCRRERGAEVEGAGRGEHLDRDDPGEPVDGAAELAGGGPAHRDVVLLHRARRDRVDARGGGEPLHLRDDRGLGVLRDHVPGVDARVVGEERRHRGCAPCRGTGRCAARRSTPRPRRRSRGSRARRRPGRRGSCRWTPPGRRRARPGCPPRGELARRDLGGVLDGVPRGAVHLRRAAQRVGVLHPVAVGPAVAGDHAGVGEHPGQAGRGVRLPGVRRSACRSAAKTRSVPSWPSTDIAAATSAVRSSIRRSWIAITSMPSIPSVPLISARPSLASSSTGSSPAARSASAAGIGVPCASRTSPSPISASAQCRAGPGRRNSPASRTPAPPG